MGIHSEAHLLQSAAATTVRFTNGKDTPKVNDRFGPAPMDALSRCHSGSKKVQLQVNYDILLQVKYSVHWILPLSMSANRNLLIHFSFLCPRYRLNRSLTTRQQETYRQRQR